MVVDGAFKGKNSPLYPFYTLFSCGQFSVRP